jgi:hypothetical protein
MFEGKGENSVKIERMAHYWHFKKDIGSLEAIVKFV